MGKLDGENAPGGPSGTVRCGAVGPMSRSRLLAKACAKFEPSKRAAPTLESPGI